MPNPRVPSRNIKTAATAERSPAIDPKGGVNRSINLRIEANTRQLIDEAASILGKTRTEFMIESARRLTCCSTNACSRWIPTASTPSCTRSTILLRQDPSCDHCSAEFRRGRSR